MKKIALLLVLLLPFSLFCIPQVEELVFEIKYGFIKAGHATLKTEPITFRDSTKCLKFSSVAKTNGFFDKIFKVRDYVESIWRIEDKVSLRFTKKLREGSYRQHRIHHYYPSLNKTAYLKYKKKKKSFSRKEMEIPANTQDILSAFYYVRQENLVVGDTIVVNVTADGRNYPASVAIHEIEDIDTNFGKKECLKIEPILKGEGVFKQTGNIYIWLTNDEKKIPILLESKIIFGHFRAILKEIKK